MGGINFDDIENDGTEDEAVERVTEMAKASGAPRFVYDNKEEERQFNIGKLPLSILDAIDDLAHENKQIRRSFVLKALKDAGVPIPNELLVDRRRRSKRS